MVPRFYYTLSIKYYIGQLFKQLTCYNRPVKINKDYFFYNYGRTALRVLLSSITNYSLRVGVQAYTCHSVFEAIKRAKHTIVFIDITDEFKMDLNDLKAKLNDIDVLIITHTFGFPDRIDEIKQIAFDKVLIEDCSHAYSSKYKGMNTGSHLDAAFFSTGIGKLPPLGSGGFLHLNNQSAFPLLELEDQKLIKTTFFSEILTITKLLLFSILSSKWMYRFLLKIGKILDSKYDIIKKLDFNESKGHSFSTRFLLDAHDEIKAQLNVNKSNFLLLNQKINNFHFESYDESNCNFFPLLLENRNFVFDILLKNRIESGKHFSNAIVWAKEYGYRDYDCPNTESIVNKVLTVPIHKGVSFKEISLIAQILQEGKF